MGVMAVPVSLILLGIVLFVESNRKKPGCYVDFLLPVSLMFIVLFGIIPSYVLLSDFGGRGPGWDWMVKNSFKAPAFLAASLISIAGYGAVLFGYFFKNILDKASGADVMRRGPVERAPGKPVVSEGKLLLCGVVLGLTGAVALHFYARSIGGINVMIEYAAAFRGDPPVISKLAFLKKVAPLVVVSSYFFFALALTTRGQLKRGIAVALFAIMLALSLIVLFHQSGRLQLMAYLIIFPLALMIRADRVNGKAVAATALLFLFFTLFGKELFHFFIQPSSLSNKMAVVSQEPVAALDFVLSEFTFPFLTLANAIDAVPAQVTYRWFSDLPISIIHLLPQRLLDLKDLPETVTMVNVQLFQAPIPVDLLSFGYFSMGFAGVLIVCFIFGLLLRAFSRLFPANGPPVMVIFRAAWIMFFAFNVMYGNPHHALEAGFSLFIATALLFFIVRRRRV